MLPLEAVLLNRKPEGTLAFTMGFNVCLLLTVSLVWAKGSNLWSSPYNQVSSSSQNKTIVCVMSLQERLFFPTAARCRKKGKGSSDTSMLPRGQFVMLLLCGSSFFYQHFINQILFTLYRDVQYLFQIYKLLWFSLNVFMHADYNLYLVLINQRNLFF